MKEKSIPWDIGAVRNRGNELWGLVWDIKKKLQIQTLLNRKNRYQCCCEFIYL